MTSSAPAAIAFELPPPIDRSSLTPVLTAHLRSAEIAPGALRRAGFHELVAAVRTALAGPLPSARAALRLMGRGPSVLAGWDATLTRDLAAAAGQEIVLLSFHRDAEARGLALERLVDLGPEAALPVLARALSDGDPGLRADALGALEGSGPAALEGAAGPPGEAFARALIELAHADPQWTVRQRAVRVLGRLWAGAPNRNVVGAALIHTLERDASAYVREAAASAFALRKPAELEPAVRASLERAAASDPEARTRDAASRALGSP
jgi:HEAT repeat protein